MKTLAITAIALVATTSLAFAAPSTNTGRSLNAKLAPQASTQQPAPVELTDQQLDGVTAAGCEDPTINSRNGAGLINVSGNDVLSGNSVALGGIGILGTGVAESGPAASF